MTSRKKPSRAGKATKPAPRSTAVNHKKPAPMAAKKAAPIAAKKPAPVAAKKPAPTAGKKPAPVVAKKPAPVVAKKPAPTAAKKSAPTAAKKPAPVVAKKPAPVVAKKPAVPPVQVPVFVEVLARLPRRDAAAFSLDDAASLERAFGWKFPREAWLMLEGLRHFALEGGAAEPLDLAGLRRVNLLDDGPADATSWTASRLGLLCVARDGADNRLLVDVAEPSGNAPVWLCTSKLGLAASAIPVFPRATDLLHCFALYTLGKPARDAAADVDRLAAELETMRKRRPSLFHGRDEAMARLAAAFGGNRGDAQANGPAPTAEDEGRLANELEAARERHRALWMPFMEQFARWSVYWRLLWNGPQSFSVGTDTQDVALLQAWRSTLPVGAAVCSGRAEAVTMELGQREPAGRALFPFAEARVFAGHVDDARALMAKWDVTTLGPPPARAERLFAQDKSTPTAAPATRQGVDWPSVLKLSRARTEKFFLALGAQFTQDVERHGTSNLLGATKVQVRDNGMGSRIVEAGLGHVPLEVRKDLFEGKPVQLSGQFLQALTRELTRRLHEPAKKVERTLARVRDTLQEHINQRVPLAIPHVGQFRIKNEPAPSGAPRLYLLVDVDPAMVAAAQKTVLHQVHADYSDYAHDGQLD